MSAYLQIPDLPHTLRNRYLETLSEPQEWFLEEMVRAGEIWVSGDAGYAVFSGDALVEFYAKDSDSAHVCLSNLHRQRPFTKALCKSFDPVLMGAAKRLGWSFVETGFLFRKRNRAVLPKLDIFQLVKARSDDLAQAWDIGRDFYDNKEDVEQIFRSGGLWIGNNDGQMVGNGVMNPVDGSLRIVDVGMVTRPSQRNKGFASAIVAAMADVLESEGKRPICGCAESNIASKTALENAGFVSEHRLVQIDFKD